MTNRIIILLVLLLYSILLGWLSYMINTKDTKPFTVYVNFDNRSVYVDYYTNIVIYSDVNSDFAIKGEQLYFSTGGFGKEQRHFLELK